MTVTDLVLAMQYGEEIEFYLNGNCYFLQPDYERAQNDQGSQKPPYPFTVLFDAKNYDNPTILIVGTTENIISYVFEGKYTLKDNFNEFKILW